MAGENLRKLVDRSLGTGVSDLGPEHAMTVKLSQLTYAKLRALVELVGRPKTPLASEILEAAIDDFIEALPDEFVIDTALEEKMLGLVLPSGTPPYTLQNLVGWAASRIMQDDADREKAQERLLLGSIESQLSNKNGGRN